MKQKRYVVISALVLSLAMLGTVWAAETSEEKELQKEANAIHATAGNAQGEKIVATRLEKDFKVTEAQVQALRDKKMGYGEISIVLSLAQKMPGGVTEANIQQVMTLRQGPPAQGWGEVSRKLGTKLGTVVSQVKNVNRESHRDAKREGRGDKEQLEKGHEGHGAMDRDMTGHEGMGMGSGPGPGMSHGKSK